MSLLAATASAVLTVATLGITCVWWLRREYRHTLALPRPASRARHAAIVARLTAIGEQLGTDRQAVDALMTAIDEHIETGRQFRAIVAHFNDTTTDH